MTKINYIGKTLLIETEKKKILVIGDLHLGYEEALNKTGVFVSRKLFDEVIEEFDKIFEFIGNKYGEKELAGRNKGLRVNYDVRGSEMDDEDESVGDNKKGLVDEIVFWGM